MVAMPKTCALSLLILSYFYLRQCNGKLYTLNDSTRGHNLSSENGVFTVDSSYTQVFMAPPNTSKYTSTVVWTVNNLQQNYSEEISSLEITNDGNLILNFRNGFEYQSFSNPSDKLLPNQTLTNGMTGAYVNYNQLNTMGRHMNYVIWMLGMDCNFNNSYSDNPFQVRYDGTHLHFSSECQGFTLQTSKSSRPILPYLQVDNSSGNLVSFTFDSSLSKWIEDSKPLELATTKNGTRKLRFETAACSSMERGACDLNGSCKCLHSRNIDYNTDDYNMYRNNYFDFNHTYTSFNNASLYWYSRGEAMIISKSNEYLMFYEPRPGSGFTFASCRNNCMSHNTSQCLAFLYDNQSSHCFFIPGDISYNAIFSISTMIYRTDYEATPSPSFDTTLLVLIIPAAVLIACIVALVTLVVVQKKVNRLSLNPKREIEELLASMKGLPQRFSYTSLEAATRSFSEKLGSGGFGSVYKGVLYDGQSVAVKKLDTTSGTHGVKQFVTEVAGMGGISHFNVLKLCGFCIEATTTECLLVYDLMLNGSLDKWLFESEKHQAYLTWQQRIDIALGTAQGLYYLHEECSEPILHLDIKPQNILLDDKFTPKLADFGMAKLLKNRDITQVHTCMRGTPGYMAPEWLTHFTATKRSDVFSYGMVLLELIGGRRNVDLSKLSVECADDKLNEDEEGKEDGAGWYFPAWVAKQVNRGNLIGVVDQKVRENASEKIQQVRMIVHLALWCIQGNPNSRPSMQTIVQVLQGHLELGPPPAPLALSDMTEITFWSSYNSSSVKA